METAVKEKSLCEIFNESAAALYEAFPERLEKLVVLLLPLEQPVYISPDIAEHLSKNVAAVKEAVKERSMSLLLNHNATAIVRRGYALAEKTVQFIALRENPSSLSSSSYTKEMRLLASFDHEIGHLVVKDGYPSLFVSRHLAECAADAYMALRHIQRFGKDTDFSEYSNTAFSAVVESYPTHYTNAVLQKVKQLSGETDISALSLRETAKLAAKIAEEYRFPGKTLKKIRDAFLPARNFFTEHGWETALVACAEIMRENKNDPDIYRAGKEILSIPVYKKYINETSPFWQDAFAWMAQHEKESGISLDPVKDMDAARASKKSIFQRVSNFVLGR